MSFLLKKIACPPSFVIPTSKETRVRVLDFSKIIPSVLSFKSSIFLPLFAFDLSSIARSIISSKSFFTSSIDMRFRFIVPEIPFTPLKLSMIK